VVLSWDHHDVGLNGFCHRRAEAGRIHQTSWQPVHGWTCSGGDYVIASYGDRFMIVEGVDLGSLDDRSQLARAGKP